MTLPRLLALTALSLAAVACQSPDYSDIMVQSSDADADRFAGKTTYSWGGVITPILDADSRWIEPHPEVAGNIVSATDDRLAERGFEYTTSGADLMIYYGGGADMTRMPIVDGEKSQDTRLDARSKEALCIMITDAETGSRLWAGVASGDVDWSPSERGTKARIEHAVAELFEGFPKSSDG